MKFVLTVTVLATIGMSAPLPHGTTLTEINVPTVEPIQVNDNTYCDLVQITTNYTIASSLQKSQVSSSDYTPVMSLWYLSFNKLLNNEPLLNVLVNNTIVHSYTPTEFSSWMNTGEYTDEYISVQFEDCKSWNQMVGYITDDMNKQYPSAQVKKMYKHIEYAKRGFFCGDNLVCIKNYCTDKKFKHYIYDPSTMSCYYSKNPEMIDCMYTVTRF
jgi:hypothetical protein